MRAKAAQADGIHMPRFTYDQSLDEIKRVTTGAPFAAGKDAALFADAKTKIAKLVTDGKITADEGKAFEKAVADAMTTQMKPAYDRVAAFLTEDKPNGAERRTGKARRLCRTGVEFYNATLYLQTTTDMTADEIHELGLSEVARIRAEMEKVKRRPASRARWKSSSSSCAPTSASTCPTTTRARRSTSSSPTAIWRA